MRIHRIVKKGILATTTLTRTNLVSAMGDMPYAGKLDNLILHITAIAGGAAQFVKVTLGNEDDDSRYILSALINQAINIDSVTATVGTVSLDLDGFAYAFEETDDLTTDAARYTGWWLGLDLDAGTATVEARLTVTG